MLIHFHLVCSRSCAEMTAFCISLNFVIYIVYPGSKVIIHNESENIMQRLNGCTYLIINYFIV